MTPWSDWLVPGWTPLSAERLLPIAAVFLGLSQGCGPKDGVESHAGSVTRATNPCRTYLLYTSPSPRD